jgi:hypothetical protein
MINAGSFKTVFKLLPITEISSQNTISADVKLFAGTVLQIGVWHNSSATITMNATTSAYNYFNCHKID